MFFKVLALLPFAAASDDCYAKTGFEQVDKCKLCPSAGQWVTVNNQEYIGCREYHNQRCFPSLGLCQEVTGEPVGPPTDTPTGQCYAINRAEQICQACPVAPVGTQCPALGWEKCFASEVMCEANNNILPQPTQSGGGCWAINRSAGTCEKCPTPPSGSSCPGLNWEKCYMTESLCAANNGVVIQPTRPGSLCWAFDINSRECEECPTSLSGNVCPGLNWGECSETELKCQIKNGIVPQPTDSEGACYAKSDWNNGPCKKCEDEPTIAGECPSLHFQKCFPTMEKCKAANHQN